MWEKNCTKYLSNSVRKHIWKNQIIRFDEYITIYSNRSKNTLSSKINQN